MHDTPGWTTTFVPSFAVVPGPTASTSPAMSRPSRCGDSSLIAGPPRRSQIARWFTETARMRTRTSPGPGSGTGSCSSRNTSGPPCSRNTIAVFDMVRTIRHPAGMRVVTVPCLSDNFAYLIIDGGRAVALDPSEAAPIESVLPKENVALAAIWLTHHHWDHVGGVADLVDKPPGLDVVIGRVDADKLKPETRRCVPRREDEGDRVALNNVVAHVIHNPGHTLGAVSYHIPDHPLGCGSVFTGDTLLAAGCGRVFEGDTPMMYESLHQLAQHPDRTKIYFGREYTAASLKFAAAAEPDNGSVREAMQALHTPSTPSPVAQARAASPFLRAADAPEFARRREWKNTIICCRFLTNMCSRTAPS